MSMAVKYGMNRRMAKGGDVKRKDDDDDSKSGTPGGVHADVSRKEWGGAARRGTSLAGEHTRGAARAKEAGQNRAASSRSDSAKNLHKEALRKLKNDRTDRRNLAEGGDVSCASCDDGVCMEHGGLVDRIMMKRMPDVDDDLDVMDDGYISDDEIDDVEMADEDEDMIARIMRGRAKRPA